MISSDDINNLIINQHSIDSLSGNRGFERLCLHKNESEILHIMLIKVAPNESYPFHLHKEYPEFYFVISGTLTLRIRCGSLSHQDINLDDKGDRGFYMPCSTPHSVFNPSEHAPCIFLECRPGPFNPSDNVKL